MVICRLFVAFYLCSHCLSNRSIIQWIKRACVAIYNGAINRLLKMFALIAYAQMPPINAQAGVSRGSLESKFKTQSLNISMLYVYEQRRLKQVYGIVQTTHAFVALQCDKYQTLMNWLVPFCLTEQ